MAPQSPTAARPNIILIGTIWGVVVGVLLTILGTIGLVAMAFVTTPDVDDEWMGYLLFIIPTFVCGGAIVPMAIGGAIAGGGMGAFYHRQPYRLTGGTPTLIGVGMGAILFVILFGLIYAVFGGSPFTQAGNLDVQNNIELALWVSPFLAMMMLGYGWLSNLLNKRVPAPA
jgi:hypothetical protein